MKVVINTCFGGFNLSEDCLKFCGDDYKGRSDPKLIEYIEKYGSKKASGGFSNLEIVDVPKGTYFRIDEYDGYESIITKDEEEWTLAE